MFSQVEDCITLVEETVDEEGEETLAERVDFTNIDQEVEDDADDYEMEEQRSIVEGTSKTRDAVEDAVDDLVDTVREKVQELHQSGRDLPNILFQDRKRGSGSESDSDEDNLGYEESGEEAHQSSSSEWEDDQEGDDQEEDGGGGAKKSGERDAPGGADL